MTTGNTSPQFCKNGSFGSGTAAVPLATSANTKSDGSSTGIGTDMTLVFSADATYGSLVEYVRFFPTASVANTSTVATVLRLYVSSANSGATTAANTTCIYESAQPIVVAASSTIANNPIDIPVNMRIPAGWYVLASQHIAPATNTAWKALAVGGDY